MSTIIYPSKEWYFEGTSSEDKECILEEKENMDFENDIIKQKLFMVLVANPTLLISDCKNYNQHMHNLYPNNKKIYSMEDYVSHKIDELISRLELNIASLYKINAYFDFINSEPENERPYIYIKQTFDTDFLVANELGNINTYINSVITRFKMWAMADISSLAQSGMEAKDKTKYVDDKFDYTDVMMQLQNEFESEFDFLYNELFHKIELETVQMFYDTKEIDMN